MKKIIVAVILFWSMASFAMTDQFGLKTSADRERFNELSHDLRCLVCQNQSLADSNAFLADDLRHTIATMILAGKSNEEIKHYLVNRYGDFILYQPTFSKTTYLLWVGPFAFLIIGFFVLFKRLR